MLSNTDPRVSTLRSLLSNRVLFQKEGDIRNEMKALNIMKQGFKDLENQGFKKFPNFRKTFKGGRVESSPTTGINTYIKNINKRMKELESLTSKPETKVETKVETKTQAKTEAKKGPPGGPTIPLEDLIIQQSLRGLENKAKQQAGPRTALAVPIPSGDDRDTFDVKDSKTGLDAKHTPSLLQPTNITELPPLPPNLSVIDKKKGNYKPIKEYNQFMTRVRKLEITPEDFIRNLDIEELKSLPPRVAQDPTYQTMIKDRIKKLKKKEAARDRLLFEKELEEQKKIEASREELHESDITDYQIAPSELSISAISHINPIALRQFQFDDPDNISVMARNALDADTLNRRTRIRIFDDTPKLTEPTAEKLEKSMKKRLRKPKPKFDYATEQRQPLQLLQPTNVGESGLSSGELMELMGFPGGKSNANAAATLRYLTDRY